MTTSNKISLRGNHITQIAADAFGGYHPNSLDLSRNNLKYLDQLTFEPLLVNDTTIFVEGKLATDDSQDNRFEFYNYTVLTNIHN